MSDACVVFSGRGAVYSFDPVGSYQRDSYKAGGSASAMLQPLLDNQVIQLIYKLSKTYSLFKLVNTYSAVVNSIHKTIKCILPLGVGRRQAWDMSHNSLYPIKTRDESIWTNILLVMVLFSKKFVAYSF